MLHCLLNWPNMFILLLIMFIVTSTMSGSKILATFSCKRVALASDKNLKLDFAFNIVKVSHSRHLQ